ncbi:10340_t:CDS:1 [Ambispora gerdemannii]|uniref:10340_t:CDS:1 n=1 Tax=Ambispora gerdemannii TaxID=144530 RepID=A0A9N9GCB8_9GLOM|nr:10340_t:CDS:1 [Ambispora gerdemannii]
MNNSSTDDIPLDVLYGERTDQTSKSIKKKHATDDVSCAACSAIIISSLSLGAAIYGIINSDNDLSRLLSVVTTVLLSCVLIISILRVLFPSSNEEEIELGDGAVETVGDIVNSVM